MYQCTDSPLPTALAAAVGTAAPYALGKDPFTKPRAPDSSCPPQVWSPQVVCLRRNIGIIHTKSSPSNEAEAGPLPQVQVCELLPLPASLTRAQETLCSTGHCTGIFASDSAKLAYDRCPGSTFSSVTRSVSPYPTSCKATRGSLDVASSGETESTSPPIIP